MNKELQNINEISGLSFESVGKRLPFSGSGRKRRLPMFNINWDDVIPSPIPDYTGIKSVEELQAYSKNLNKNWEGEVSAKIQEGIDKLVKAGYTVEDPILMTYVYKYSAYFIYK